jgi:hypothetical protein
VSRAKAWDDPNYLKKHKRVYRERGKAASFSCVKHAELGQEVQARDWAQIHETDGEDPWADYIPLCRSCHLKYDDRPGAIEETWRDRGESGARLRSEIAKNASDAMPYEDRVKQGRELGLRYGKQAGSSGWTEERKAALAERNRSSEMRDRVSNARKGKPISAEHRAKIAAAWTPERRKKASELMKKIRASGGER